jgi:hypothetical protein
MNDNDYYTYVILDPRKPGQYKYDGLKMSFLFEPIYVGKGTRDRCYRHIREAIYDWTNNIVKNRKIRKILRTFSEEEFRTFIIKYKENISGPISVKHENKILAVVGRIIDNNKGPLTNVLDEGYHIPRKILKAAATKGAVTRKRNGSNITGALKGAATRKRNGGSRDAGLKAAATRKRRDPDKAAYRKMATTMEKRKKDGKKVGVCIKLLFISPDGEEFVVYGGQLKFLKEHNLSIILLRHKNQGPIKANNRQYSQTAKNTVGWSVQHI